MLLVWRALINQNINDNMNGLLSQCAANSFAGIKYLTGYISLQEP